MTDQNNQAPPEQPQFDEGDEALLGQVAMDPIEWRSIWTRHAALTGEGLVDPATLEKEVDKLRRAGRYDEAMRAGIASQMGPTVLIPDQPDFHSLPPRLQAEYIRRGLAARR